jgi:hypothetical protein
MSTAIGFDNVHYNQGLLLSLPFREGAGTTTRDWAKPYHPLAFGGTPTWTNLANDLTVLDFGNLDEITCPGADSTDLDFTSGDFSLAAWVKHDDASMAHVILNRAQLDVCGWEWYTAVGNIALRTNQAGSREGAAAIGCVETGQWQFFCVARYALTAQMYVDGVPVETIYSTNGMLDPVACGAQTFRVANNPHSNYFDGMMWNPRAWNRLLSRNEILAIYEVERGLFGV